MLQCLENKDIRQCDKKESQPGEMFSTSNGTTVLFHTENGTEKIAVRSETGQIIFEYHPDTKKCQLTVPEGDLCFGAPLGNISFSAGHNIHLKCPGDITIEGEEKVHIHSGRRSPNSPTLILDHQQAKLCGSKIAVAAQNGDFAIAKTTFRSRRLAAKIDRARINADDIEIVAETIRQKAKNVVQNVENLLQVNAGRMRTFVRGLYNLKGERTYLKADKDMKLKGDKIHLR